MGSNLSSIDIESYGIKLLATSGSEDNGSIEVSLISKLGNKNNYDLINFTSFEFVCNG